MKVTDKGIKLLSRCFEHLNELKTLQLNFGKFF